MPGSAKDRQLIHYMSVYGTISMTGFAPSGYLTTILARCRDETPLRAAFVALGQSHLEYCSVDVAEWRPSYDAIKAYGVALTSLRRLVSSNAAQHKTSTILACCMLLYLVGRMQNDPMAGEHMNVSLQIVKAWETSAIEERETNETMKLQYHELLEKLIAHASICELQGEPHPEFVHPTLQTVGGGGLLDVERNLEMLAKAPVFNSVHQIHKHLLAILTGPALAYLRTFADTCGSMPKSQVSLPILGVHAALMLHVHTWRLAVDAWQWRKPITELDAESQIQFMVTMSYHWVAKALLFEALWDGDVTTDPWARKPFKLLRYGRSVLDLKLGRRRKEALPDSLKRGWHADWNIDGSLRLLAKKSKIPEVIEEANELAIRILAAG